jgi:hypothetical protein
MSKQADPLLKLVCESVTMDAPIAITLMVSGVIVTGSVICFDEYINATSAGSESGNSLAPVLDESLPDESLTDASENSQPGCEPRTYIHLKDAKFFAGNNLIPTGKGIFWRGALDEVNGFTFGSLTSS